MQSFGDYLKRKREDRNISLREVARLTNISERYLDFIEKDDYVKVPEGPHIRGYISSYAMSIGISADEALNRFDTLCRGKKKAKDVKKRITKDKITQASMAFLLNNRSWLLLCFTIPVLLTCAVYHSFSQNQEKAHVVANLQGPKDKGLQATFPMKSKDNVLLLNLNDYSMSSGKPECPKKDAEHGTNERVHDVSLLKKAPSLQAKGLPKGTNLPSLPSEQLIEVSKQTSNAQEMDAHSKNASKVELVELTTLTTLPRLEHNNSDQIVLKKKLRVQRRQIPKSKPLMPGQLLSRYPKNKQEILEFTETWRKAWQSKDMETYIDCYNKSFKHDRMDLAAYLAYKSRLSQKYKFIKIDISEVSVLWTETGAKVAFHQVYRSDRYRATGRKTLHLTFKEQRWGIEREDWFPPRRVKRVAQ